MNILEQHIKTGEFAHAYLVPGDFTTSGKIILEATRAILGVREKVEFHPDFSHIQIDAFSIKDSQNLRYMAGQKSMLGGAKVFIIEVFSFSSESANALLKLFEEPFEGTHFFVVVPFKEDIIPTLASRLTVVDVSDFKEKEEEKDLGYIQEFLVSLPSKRLEMVKKISEERQNAIEFISDLEIYLRNKSDLLPGNKVIKSLEEIQKIKKIIYIKGSSPKMILEHLALTVPKG